MNFPGIVVAKGPVTPEFLSEMDRSMRAWTMQAARGECGWVCSDCGASWSEGMPDACAYDNASCTAIIQRDKAEACATPPAPPTTGEI